ncbi:MAG: c-type cytochrome, partial [Verrucomicrobiales bacterium]
SIYAKARASRQEVINRYLDSERLKGDAARGQAKFETICIACHRSGDKGFPVGPDRVTFKTKGRTIILTNVLDPNREVAPQYLAYALTTTGGETATGTIASENPSSVTLRLPFGEEKEYSRASIASLQALGQSLMPEGLEAQLTPQDLADLLEYITTAP